MRPPPSTTRSEEKLPGVRLVVGVEDPDELAGDRRERRVDVLGLGRGPEDAVGHEPRVAPLDLVQLILDWHFVGGVVGQDDLDTGGVVDAQERVDGLQHRGRLVRQVGGDDGAGRRGWRSGFLGRLGARDRGSTLHPDQDRGHEQRDHDHDVHDVRQLEPEAPRDHVARERQQDARDLRQRDLERHPSALERGADALRSPRGRHRIHARVVLDGEEVEVGGRVIGGGDGLAPQLVRRDAALAHGEAHGRGQPDRRPARLKSGIDDGL